MGSGGLYLFVILVLWEPEQEDAKVKFSLSYFQMSPLFFLPQIVDSLDSVGGEQSNLNIRV